MSLVYGLVTGVLFGILLQRSETARYDRQIGALRLKDMTIVKFMLTSVLVAAVGVYLLHDLGLVKLAIKPTILGGVIPGGLLFGMGWGLAGYCPGTSAAALAEGRLDALWAILGMLLGAALFAESYPLVRTSLLTWGNYGKITLPQLLGVSHWVVIAALSVGAVALFRWLEKKGL